MNMTIVGRLLARLLKFLAGQGGNLGAAVDNNPRLSAYLTTGTGVLAAFGISDAGRARIGETLITLGRMLLDGSQ